MSKLLTGVIVVLVAAFIWLNWRPQGETKLKAAEAPPTATTVVGVLPSPTMLKAAEAPTATTVVGVLPSPTIVGNVVASNIPLDEKGNLLYLNSSWESVRENPETATGTIMVPANRVVWGDRLIFVDCEGNKQDLKQPSIMALTCETEVSVTWGALALEPEVTVALAKPYLDTKYRDKAGFPKEGFAVFPNDGAEKPAP